MASCFAAIERYYATFSANHAQANSIALTARLEAHYVKCREKMCEVSAKELLRQKLELSIKKKFAKFAKCGLYFVGGTMSRIGVCDR